MTCTIWGLRGAVKDQWHSGGVCHCGSEETGTLLGCTERPARRWIHGRPARRRDARGDGAPLDSGGDRRAADLREGLGDQPHALLDRGLSEIAVAKLHTRRAVVGEAVPGKSLHAHAARRGGREQR